MRVAPSPTWVSLAIACSIACSSACFGPAQPAPAPESTEEGETHASAAISNAAGSTCGGRSDCAADQACVAQVCRYRRTSAAGEVLATAAEHQRESGDDHAAHETYQLALSAYDSAHAPVPPDVICGAALAALALRESPEDRERGARAAHRCLHGALPGHAMRTEVVRVLAGMRYEGLSLSALDEAEPEAFFTEATTRPTLDAIEVTIRVSEGNAAAGYDQVEPKLSGEAARRGIAECFVQDWEQRHGREARASLLLKLTTRLRDLGNFEIYMGRVEVHQTTEQEGFEGCVARVLTALVEEGPRLTRAAIWQLPIEVRARLL